MLDKNQRPEPLCQPRRPVRGDPFIESMTAEERSTFLHWGNQYGTKTARRLVLLKRVTPAGPAPHTVGRESSAGENKVSIGDWFVGVESHDGVRIVLRGVTHDLTARQAQLLTTALAVIAA